MVEFRSSNSWGAAFCVDVLHHGMLAGHIRRQLATGVFRYYYRNVHDELQPTLQDRDLEALKRRIRETTASFPATPKIHAADDRLSSDQQSDAGDRLDCPRGAFRLSRVLADTIRH
jgi:hypothetical protein